MKKKKNRFLLFLCSLVPGAGEMYLGFMKMGVSLMSAFALVIMIAAYAGLGILACVAAVIWFYGFFHANNLGALSDDEFFRMEDTYLFGTNEMGLDPVKELLSGKYRKGLAVILIVFGISMLWQTVCNLLYDILGSRFYNAYIRWFTRAVSNEAPAFILSIVIIWFGIKLIQGKKVELNRLEEEDETEKEIKTTEVKKEETQEEEPKEADTREAAKAAEATKTAEATTMEEMKDTDGQEREING